MSEQGSVETRVSDSICTIIFSHPKGNSLPSTLLQELTRAIRESGGSEIIKAIVLSSSGSGPFCAGASFDELAALTSVDRAEQFFRGFADVLLAMQAAHCIVLTRVQGKAVGGGVGIVAASDYSVALSSSEFRLSELALNIGPFVIGPAVERRIGSGAFAAMTLDTEWRDAPWALQHGLISKIASSPETLEEEIGRLTARLAKCSRAAITELKGILRAGTEHWHALLPARARMSAQLSLSEECRRTIAEFQKK